MATETKKSNSLVTVKVAPETFDVTLTLPKSMMFEVLNVGDVPFDLTKVHVKNLAYACVHGWGQRLPDMAAIGLTDKDGKIIPKAERSRIKYEKMNEGAVHYESGSEEWSLKAKGDGSGNRSITIEAIAKVKSITYDEAKAMVEKHAAVHKVDSKKALAMLRNAEAVQKAILDIRAERAKANEDDVAKADEFLANLGTEPAEEETEQAE